MTYSVSQQFYFREVRRSIPAGGSVYLEEHVARAYMKSHPGLLSPARTTTQARPEAVRDESPVDAVPADQAADETDDAKPRRKKRS